MHTEARSGSDRDLFRQFSDDALLSMRARQRELMEVLAEDVRDPLMPYVEGTPPLSTPVACERALRERVERVIEEHGELRTYLERSRRSRFAELRRTVIEGHYSELAGDAPAGMDEELSFAVSEIDDTVAQPTYEEIALLARIVPLMAWADYFGAPA
ncbi:MAG TPA: hypothetical protein VMU76_09160 [Acidimicrobiales bacterium]|nr:hypothetical protein [Acidimicrobiales bacterium]